MKKLLWVGSRLSDVEGADEIFTNAITLFGSSNVKLSGVSYQEISGRRINQNSFSRQSVMSDYYRLQIRSAIDENKGALFMCYGSEANSLGDEFRDFFPFANNRPIINLLKDKFRIRSMLSQIVPVPPCICLFKEDVNPVNIGRLFPDSRRIVIQAARGAGGEGTIVTEKVDNLELTSQLPGHELLVSPYVDGIPVNVHIIVGMKDIAIFSPSIQLIERRPNGRLTYRGGDFSAGVEISKKQKQNLEEMAALIGQRLQASGYRGVAGIDSLLSEDKALFIEINPRFQASSYVLNKCLSKHGAPSLQKLHMEAFLGGSVSINECREIRGSFFVFTKDKNCVKNHNTLCGSTITADWEIDNFGDGDFEFDEGAPVARVYIPRAIVRMVEGVVISDTADASALGLSSSAFIHE